MPSQPSRSGIVTDEASGERHIPESTRADGSTRKAIRIRPGYRPPEDIELYRNRTAQAHRERARRIGIPGTEADDADRGEGPVATSAAASKNAKRREARKRAKAANEDTDDDKPQASVTGANGGDEVDERVNQKASSEAVDPQVERDKKVRNIKKKLRQAKELKDKKEGGEALLPEQISKVIKITELIRELEAMGLDADGEPKQHSTSPTLAVENSTDDS